MKKYVIVGVHPVEIELNLTAYHTCRGIKYGIFKVARLIESSSCIEDIKTLINASGNAKIWVCEELWEIVAELGYNLKD